PQAATPTDSHSASNTYSTTDPNPSANTAAKPAVKPAAKPAVQASETDPLTPDEKKRLKKLLETQKVLQAAPDWNDFLKAQEEELHRLRDEILPGMTEATRSTLRAGASNPSSASGQHIADAGSDAEVRDITLRLLDKDRETVYEIDAALERIRLGTYGICEMSLEPIPRGRLQVRPYCRLTVACQQEYEKKHGTAARFRPQNSRLIGYAGSQNEIDPAVSLDDDEE
ncbi:MAG: TraR/DksA family transcriptional regulator, partial [Akkermansiaceae bacterium]|nr:TraR/DksA family transcriptional regulator [Akkermansiaceae bacterium]